MKKLMIAAAFVSAAAFAQAACMSWSVGSKALPTVDGSSRLYKGETAYFLYLGTSDNSATIYNNLKSGDMTVAAAISAYSVDNAPSTATADKSAGNIAAREVTGIEAKFAGVNPGDNGYWALLVQDGDKFILSSAAAKKFYLTGDPSFGDKQTVSFVSGNFSATAETRTGWTTAAPEPTSAMLILLGVAGLALKRRRA